MKARLFSSVLLSTAVFASPGISAFRAAEAPATPSTADEAEPESKWIFSLIPRPFQSRPRLEMTVFTNFTEMGKARPPASPEAPHYYRLHTGGRREIGGLASSKPVDAATVERHLRAALGTNGYLTADEKHPPSLLIVFGWGSHTFVSNGAEEISVDAALRTLLDRAALVGGDKFAEDLHRAVKERLALAEASAPPLGRGSDSDSMDLGAAAGVRQMNAIMDPVKLFMQKSTKNDFLVRQAGEDCYYVVASAYDYQSVTENHRQLLWRTRMTVGLRGVAQTEAVPGVINAAARFLGRETKEAEVLLKRAAPKTNVEIGGFSVVGEEPAKNPEPKPAPRK